MAKRTLEEFLVFDNTPGPSRATEESLPTQCIWSVNHTKLFLDLYKQCKPKVGTFEIRTQRQLWEILSQEINTMLNTQFTASHCENRWRVLERAYKKYIDNQNKTGQGRRHFEYLEEMQDIFKGKRNVEPEILLGEENIEPMPIEHTTGSDDSEKELVSEIPRKKKKISATEKMRSDRRLYQNEKLKQGRERIDIKKGKLEAIREKNALIRERNEILKQHHCCCQKH